MVNPLISVIIPVYNTEPYLVECLESVINQTYKNIEILAINDGSTDNSLRILQEYSTNYQNIIVINQENAGNSVARNKGINKSKGKYIYFLDSDDYILPNTFSNLIINLEKHNLDLIRFAAEPFQDDINFKINKKLYDFQKYFKKEKVYEKQEFLFINLKAFSPSPCLYLLRRDILINNNLKFYPNIMHEDELFSLEVFLNTNRAMYDSNFYYKRRYRRESIMTSQSPEKIKKSFDSYYIVARQMNVLLDKYNRQDEIKLIKKRIIPVFNTLLNKKIDENYKKNHLKRFEGVSKDVQIYYYLKYKLKKHIKLLIALTQKCN